jgi:hypothetical protein
VTSERRRPWYFVGIVPSLLVVVAVLQAGSPVQAQVIDVAAEATEVAAGETVQITVQTTIGSEPLQAQVRGDGEAVFESTGTTTAQQSTNTGFGYGGTSTAFTLVALAPGEVVIEFLPSGSGEVEASLAITIVPSEGVGDFNPPIGPEIGVHITRWGGGTVDELIAATPAGTTSIWVTVGGEFIGYIPGAPEFVNSAFFAAFPGAEVSAGTPILAAVT